MSLETCEALNLEMNTEENISSILFYVASALFYVAAIINFAGGNRNSMAVV